MPLGNAVIGQSGGPTAVINQSLVGVVEALQASIKSGDGKVGKILGAHHAVAGMVKDDYIDLTDRSQDFLDRIGDSPSSALGSSRDKPDAAYCKRIFESFTKQNVHYFFYAGGNDSSDTCRIIAEMAAEQGYDLTAYHVPKTIDNDLMVNDHTPGFGSAGKFVAQAFMGDNLDNAALPGIKINIVMGRHAGFLTAASMLGRRPGKDDGPHLIYVPEADFSEAKFLADVERVYTKLGRCLIAVSEGIHDADGNPMMTKLQDEVEKDAHGNVQLSGTGALGEPARRPDQGQAGRTPGPKAPRPGRHLRLPATLVRRLCVGRRSGRGPRVRSASREARPGRRTSIRKYRDDPYQRHAVHHRVPADRDQRGGGADQAPRPEVHRRRMRYRRELPRLRRADCGRASGGGVFLTRGQRGALALFKARSANRGTRRV